MVKKHHTQIHNKCNIRGPIKAHYAQRFLCDIIKTITIDGGDISLTHCGYNGKTLYRDFNKDTGIQYCLCGDDRCPYYVELNNTTQACSYYDKENK